LDVFSVHPAVGMSWAGDVFTLILTGVTDRIVGIADIPDFPTTYLAQLASPFRWRDVSRARRLRPASS
jgi:hypothetical protein